MSSLVLVDIQPFSKQYISFNHYEFAKWLNRVHSRYDHVLYLYNDETLCWDSPEEVTDWLSDLGVQQSALEHISLQGKDYGFFRDLMDFETLFGPASPNTQSNNKEIADIVRYMLQYDINDSRDLLETDIEKDLIHNTHVQYVTEDGPVISIPEIMSTLESLSEPITLVGGGCNECLREIEIALLALGKKYKINQRWTY
jgi:hypothetical protein